MPLNEIAGSVLLVIGTLFCVLGIYGIFRMPDFYSRLQAAGMVLTFGAGGVLLSLLFLGTGQAPLKGMATALFLMLTAPLVTHTLARTASRQNYPLAPGAQRDDLQEDRENETPGGR